MEVTIVTGLFAKRNMDVDAAHLMCQFFNVSMCRLVIVVLILNLSNCLIDKLSNCLIVSFPNFIFILFHKSIPT